MERWVVRASAIAAAIAAAVCLAAAGQAGMSRADRELAQRMLQDVREDLEKNYYDPTYRGIDLAAHFAEARRRLDAAANATEATEILSDTLVRFGDSHTRFFPPPRSTRVDYGWEMAMVGDAALVVKVTRGSDAEARGLRPGDRVLALNRFEPARDNLWQINHYYRVIRPQSQQRLVIRTPDGRERTMIVASRVEQRARQQLEDAIEEAFYGQPAAAEGDRVVDRRILVWRLARFGVRAPVETVIKKALSADALVLDFRGNGGGAIDTLNALAGHTFDREILVATLRTRKSAEPVRARPAARPFNGKLVVLVDSASASASEVYARLVQLEGRGTVIGDRTAGKVMAARGFGHSFGLGIITFYGTSITVADLRMSDGSSLEGGGVTPDEIDLPSPEDLAAGRDPVLARAVAKMGGTLTPEAAGKLFATPR
jgi:carboxyl-terminal processing protease